MNAIDVRDLLERPGSARRVRVEEPVEGLQTELAAVQPEAPIMGELTLESVVEGIFVTGTVGGRMTLRCARCLKEFEAEFDVAMNELYVREPGPEDDYALADDLTLDPEPMVRDAVVLQMPFSPLCKPDCLGLCERCGGDRNLGECTCGPDVDPRWSALEALFADDATDPTND
ncbi:MAG: YceD family protein [Actinomycetota bacterium]